MVLCDHFYLIFFLILCFINSYGYNFKCSEINKIIVIQQQQQQQQQNNTLKNIFTFMIMNFVLRVLFINVITSLNDKREQIIQIKQ